MEKFVIDIPQKRSELENMRRKLFEVNAPPQHAELIDMMLADVDAGIARCAAEDD